jgi:hypothetical protein
VVGRLLSRFVAYLDSLLVFAVETGKRWWFAVVGVVFAALGVLQAGFGVSVSIPTPVAFGGAAFTWFLAAGAAYHSLRRAPVAADRAQSQEVQNELTDAMTRGVEQPADRTWIDATEALILRRAGTAEAALFRTRGRGLPLADEIEAKVQWIRNDLWPKVRGNFFS